MQAPTISVIVTARNEEKTVEWCLASLLKQDYRNYEILFVDAGSRDKTLEIATRVAAQNSTLKVLQIEGNPSRCRNMAIKMSNAEVIAFTDADVEVPNNWLKQVVVTLLSQPGIGGVGGPNQPKRETNGGLIDTVDLMLTTSLGSMRSAQSYDFKQKTVVKSIPCCNATYPRKVLLEVGGFDEELVGCDDTDLGYRISRSGKRLVFDPDARVLHAVKFGTLRQFTKLMFKYGRGRGYASKRKRYLFSGPAIPAAGLILSVPLLLALIVLSRSMAPLEILLGAYLVAVVGYSVGVAISRRVAKAALIGPIVLTAQYAGYFTGFLIGLLDRRPNRWSS